ncbi:Slp family lipoprotein [Glaciecola siphonariae]|uniref:Slp family lipoprotein n=1 Tax=Glaciecola siphonariae TaxID=521012 RepID=A0ABV9LWE2_9ALTE
MKKYFAILAALATLSACSMVPEPIQIADNTPLMSFDKVINSDDALSAQGEKARWGGRIVSVQNKKDVSEIEVIYFPEGHNGKPKTDQQSEGRFKAIVPGFVDPLVFEKDRLITIVGNVSAPEVGIIGEQNYTYPTLNAAGYHMWKQSTDIEVRNVGYQPFFYASPFYNRGWSAWHNPWRPNYYRSRLRVSKYNGHSQGGSVNRVDTKTRTNPPNISEPRPRRPEPAAQVR